MPSDSTEKIVKEIGAIRQGEVTSPADDAVLDICLRLARRIDILERKLKQLDKATENARHQTMRY